MSTVTTVVFLILTVVVVLWMQTVSVSGGRHRDRNRCRPKTSFAGGRRVCRIGGDNQCRTECENELQRKINRRSRRYSGLILESAVCLQFRKFRMFTRCRCSYICATTTTTTTSTTTTPTTTRTTTTPTAATAPTATATTSTTTSTTTTTPTTTLATTSSTSQTLRISAFNVQILGPTKAGKPHVMDILAKIVMLTDIILIQEIRDVTGNAIDQLFELVNNRSDIPYEMSLGARQGNSSSKEQYAYLYKPSKVSVVEAYDYLDVGDRFEREPYIIHFRPIDGGIDFFLVGIHVKPSIAPDEIDLLLQVYENTRYNLSLDEGIILGDLNADCSFFTQTEKENSDLFNQCYWPINCSVDTTVGSTDCAYDRFVICPPGLSELSPRISNVEIIDFISIYNLNQTTAEEVSDHFPIVMDLDVTNGTFATTTTTAPTTTTTTATTTTTTPTNTTSQTLTIGAFNLDILGSTKAGEPEVMDIIAKVVRLTDIMMIQEIRDVNEIAPVQLLNLVNNGSDTAYEMALGARQGRTTQEQYAYLYKPSKVSLVQAYDYVDVGDLFDREPYIAHFHPVNGGSDFFLIGIRVKPGDATPQEIDELLNVYNSARQNLSVEDGIIMGDLHADCSSFTASEKAASTLFNQCYWPINCTVDTIVTSTDCAYDRFVICPPADLTNRISNVGIIDFKTIYSLTQDEAEDVSNHYPITMDLQV